MCENLKQKLIQSRVAVAAAGGFVTMAMILRRLQKIIFLSMAQLHERAPR
jgi:hypothetical protein